MVIYHVSTKPIARSAGRSAVAAAAYRAGAELADQRTGLVHDYTRKGGVVSSDVLAPDGGFTERSALWNAAEQAEKRKDARTAREWTVALPAELDAAQRRDLALSFGAALARRYGVAVDVAIHQPDREGDNRNHHAHLLTTTRQVSRVGGELVMGDKASIELSDKKRREQGLGPAADEVTAVRQLWELTTNRALEQAGQAERIDARSLKAQGIDREATTHLGPVASEMERRGRASDRGDGNRQVIVHNAERKVLTAQIIDLKAEREHREKIHQAEIIPAADLVKTWDARKQELVRDCRARAQRLDHRLTNQIHEIGTQRWKANVNHAAQRPREPQGLLATLRRGTYEKAMTTWKETAERIVAWKKAREADLQKRLDRVREYLMPSRGKAEQTAEMKLQRERPEWAARLPQARAEHQRQQEAEQRERQANATRDQVVTRFTKIAAGRELRAHGYTDHSSDWQATPEALRKAIDSYNQQPNDMRKAVLEKLRNDPQAWQSIGRLIQQRERSMDRGGISL